MQEIILIKLGEMVLKGLNRRAFEDVLIKNIKYRLRGLGKFTIKIAQSTIYVIPQSEDADLDDVCERISEVFGIVTFSRACVCDITLDDILVTAGIGYSVFGSEHRKGSRVELRFRIVVIFPKDRKIIFHQVEEIVGKRLLKMLFRGDIENEKAAGIQKIRKGSEHLLQCFSIGNVVYGIQKGNENVRGAEKIEIGHIL